MYPRRFLYLLVGLLLLPSLTYGQVNTERMRALDVDGFRSTFGGDFALRSGHVDLFEIGGNARLDLRRRPHYVLFVGELRYATKSSEPFRDHFFGHLRYNYHFLPWLVGEAFSQLQRNGFARLSLRALFGGGLRFRHLDTETIKIFQGTTPMFEREILTVSGGTHPDRTATMRWSNYLDVRLRFTERTHLHATTYVQPRFDRFEDVRVLQQTSLSVQVTESLHLTTEFELSYDSRPPADVEKLDLSLRNGVTVTFD